MSMVQHKHGVIAETPLAKKNLFARNSTTNSHLFAKAPCKSFKRDIFAHSTCKMSFTKLTGQSGSALSTTELLGSAVRKGKSSEPDDIF